MEYESNIMFSIIIPAYNVEKYVEDCINSILRQSYLNYEIIIIDDGSIDSTAFICDTMALNIDKLTVFHKQNGGLSSARNTGIMHAKGKYIVFLDGDDELDENALANLDKELADHDSADICIGELQTIEDDSQLFSVVDYPIDPDLLQNTERKDLLNYLITNKYIHSACKIIVRTGFLKKEELFFKKGIYHEDELWSASVFVRIQSFCLCSDSFYRYRIHQNSIMTTHNKKKILDRLEIAKDLLKLAESFSDESIECRYLKERAASLVNSSFSEVLPYPDEVDTVCREIKKLVKIDPIAISKLKFFPLTKAFGFQAVCSLYIIYYRIKRALIAR